jgi:hypothetical protein
MTRPVEFTIYAKVKGLTWYPCHEKGARRGFTCEDGIVYLSGRFTRYEREYAANLAIEIFRRHGYTATVWRA